MWSLETIILLIMVHNVGYKFLLVEATLIDSILGEVRLNDVQSAKMPTTMAVVADTISLMMMIEIVPTELTSSLIEVFCLFIAERMVMPTTLCLH